jgi:hypothetical protein
MATRFVVLARLTRDQTGPRPGGVTSLPELLRTRRTAPNGPSRLITALDVFLVGTHEGGRPGCWAATGRLETAVEPISVASGPRDWTAHLSSLIHLFRCLPLSVVCPSMQSATRAPTLHAHASPGRRDRCSGHCQYGARVTGVWSTSRRRA